MTVEWVVFRIEHSTEPEREILKTREKPYTSLVEVGEVWADNKTDALTLARLFYDGDLSVQSRISYDIEKDEAA